MKPVSQKIKKGDQYGDFVAISDPYAVVKSYYSSRLKRHQDASYRYVQLKCSTCQREKESSITEIGDEKGKRCTCNPMYRKSSAIVDQKQIDDWFENLKINIAKTEAAKKLRRA